MPHFMCLVVYCGWTRETEVEREIEDLGCGAGQINCLECGNSGIWNFMEPEIPAEPCVDCKGSGNTLVSIA